MAEPTPAVALDEDDAELKALGRTVAEARQNAKPGVPHDVVRAEMLRQIDRLRRGTSWAQYRFID